MKPPISFGPSSFDSSSFDPTPVIDVIMRNLSERLEAWKAYPGIVGPQPQQAGSPSSSKQGTRGDQKPNEAELSTLPSSWKITPVAWDYEFREGPQEQHLKALGEEGWELCTVIFRPTGELWVFKRPRFKEGSG
jgi:hypothetical protein